MPNEYDDDISRSCLLWIDAAAFLAQHFEDTAHLMAYDYSVRLLHAKDYCRTMSYKALIRDGQ